MGPAQNSSPDTEYAPSRLRRGQRNATRDGAGVKTGTENFLRDIFWAAETSFHGCHDSGLLLRSAYSALLGQSSGYRVVCSSFPMHRVCSHSRAASMHPTSLGAANTSLHLCRPNGTRFLIVNHPKSLTSPVPACTALHCSPSATAMAATDRNATVPLSASALTGTNRQLLAAAHANSQLLTGAADRLKQH